MATININQNVLVFDDEDVTTANPKRRNVDWTTDITGVQCKEPSSKEYILQPASSVQIFSTQRTLTVDNTTTFNLTLNPVLSSVYRLTAVSGTAPGFRTNRGLTLSGQTITVSVNNNATATFALPGIASPNFSSVQVGDVLFLPDLTTGDAFASPFNLMNVGFWVVLAIGPVGGQPANQLVCKRLAGQDFVGVSEGPISITSNAQFVVFSSAGVQSGDILSLISGFSPVSQQNYQVQNVTDSWVEFSSGESLPLESGIAPTASGIAVYSDTKSYLRVEVDQQAVIQLNADTSSNYRLTPRTPGEPDGIAWFELWGVIYQLTIINKSSTDPLQATVISVASAF